MGADEPSGAAASGCRPCMEAGLLCFLVLQSEVLVLVTHFPSLGEKEYFNPSVFDLLAVDFFLPYEVEGTIEVKPQ